MDFFFHIGRYYMLLARVFRKPEKPSVYFERLFQEIDILGFKSLGIVVIISIFIGAVITIQSAFGLDNSWVPTFAVGFTVRESVILEFAPTILCLILAGKIGSHISSEIGTMRITEQIDALEIMGVNAASYIILPKVVGAMIIFPFLVLLSMFLSIGGGWFFGILSEVITTHQFIVGITHEFKPFNITYALIKTVVFAFLITSISAYHGYFTHGGSLEVGRSSTKAVVYSSSLILLFNLLLTQLLLV